MKLAVKVAYDGRYFQGSAYQTGKTTVLGELRRVLGNDVKMAGRTDTGVSALGNVAAFTTDMRPIAAVMSINQRCRHIWAYAYAEVDEEFNPRHARERWYRYMLPEGEYDINSMRDAAALFAGEHDFSMFSKRDARRRSTRTLYGVEVLVENNTVFIDVRGKSFLWKMVRHIASALAMVGRGEITYRDIADMLKGKGRKVPPLPAQGLILLDVMYDFEFTPVRPALELMRGSAIKNLTELRWEVWYQRELANLYEALEK